MVHTCLGQRWSVGGKRTELCTPPCLHRMHELVAYEPTVASLTPILVGLRRAPLTGSTSTCPCPRTGSTFKTNMWAQATQTSQNSTFRGPGRREPAWRTHSSPHVHTCCRFLALSPLPPPYPHPPHPTAALYVPWRLYPCVHQRVGHQPPPGQLGVPHWPPRLPVLRRSCGGGVHWPCAVCDVGAHAVPMWASTSQGGRLMS
jgi:hypothetical protein